MSAPSNSIAVLFTPASMNAEQYDEIIRQAEAVGAGNPAGRLFHICFGTENNLRVVDVYDSVDSFQAFGRTLMPILGKNGVELSRPPEIGPAYNLITATAGVAR